MPFHPDPGQVPEAAQPSVQLGVAARCRRKRLDSQHSAARVDRRGDVHIQMRVDSTRHRARALYDGHRHPFSVQVVKGWHARPGTETVAIDLLAQADQSPSGTGRAQSRLAHQSTGTSRTWCTR